MLTFLCIQLSKRLTTLLKWDIIVHLKSLQYTVQCGKRTGAAKMINDDLALFKCSGKTWKRLTAERNSDWCWCQKTAKAEVTKADCGCIKEAASALYIMGN